ncbi:MAG: hypothetical protein Alis3KO_18980 [Aliiglaciecola sp.]|uniref:DUF3718 domain-containing protein n=1 Tax=Aliiglaciecola sp. M165 TaxID=2593649 RepID=UPI00117FA059|nr:DUF3718 domain-containing protein [Aliiglaciecola sp. M165]TRY30211.1 DUF3718 domain-containing protein [Aliiglaciecola sp. M165]
MKKCLIAITALAAMSANASMFDSNEYRFKGDTYFAGFCKAVLMDDVKMLKHQLRSQVGKVAGSTDGVKRAVTSVNGVQCDGKDLITFSKEREANSVLAYLDVTSF